MPEGKKLSFLILCLLVFVRPLVCGMTYEWVNSIFQAGVIASAALIILPQIWNGKISIRRTPIDLVLIGFFVSMLLAGLFTVNTHRTLTFVYHWLQYLLLYFVVVQLVEYENVRKILLSISLSVLLIVCLYGMYQYLWGFELTREFVRLYRPHLLENPALAARLAQNRVFSTFVHAPALAGYLVVMLPIICIGIFAPSFLFKKNMVGFMVVLLLFAVSVLVLTFSDGGWIVAFASALLLVLMGWRQIIRFKVGIIILASILIVILSVILWKRPPEIPEVHHLIRSAQVRVEYWKVGVLMFKDRPILGFGPGTFGSVFPTYKILGGEETQLAHNSFVQIAAETGIVGLVLFSLIWLIVMYKGFEIAKTSMPGLCLYTSIFAFILHGVGDFNLYVPGIVFPTFVFLGMFFGMGKTKTLAVNIKPKNMFIFLGILSFVLFLISTVFRPMLAEIVFQTVVDPIDRTIKIQDLDFVASRIRTAISYNPYNAEYRFMLAKAYEKKCDIAMQTIGEVDRNLAERAVREYEKAVYLDPFMPFYHFALGRIYLKTRHWDERRVEKALSAFRMAIKRFPTRAMYYEQMGNVLNMLGRNEEAQQYFKKAQELDRNVQR